MSLTILLELGHSASLKQKKDSAGFTHDWEVFVRGQNEAKIQYYVEKVVFNLHESFPKPKRVVKDPPFSIRASGYAGFIIPIDIYLKNNNEPKRITFDYDLYLHSSGPSIHRVQKEKHTFPSPSEEFRSKLLKGGAIGEGNHENSIKEDKNQMSSRPKLGTSDVPKKHKMKLDEPRTTDFENLFGTPIKKTSKLPETPKPKEPPPAKPPNPEKSSEKDKSDKVKSNKSAHKDKDKDKEKSKDKSSENADKRNKEEKRKSKDDKSKDRDRPKEKSSKKDKEREKSPVSRPRSPSPKKSPKREPSPPPVQKHSNKEKESSKEEKKEKDKDKDKKEDKKSKKDKRDHKEGKHKDREKDKEHREHKSKDSSKSREKEPSVIKKESSPALPTPISSQNSHKTDKKPKEKEPIKEPPKEEEKIEKPEKREKTINEPEDRQKHKHKKKDRKEKKEEKHSKKEERKIEKHPSSTTNSKEVVVKEEKPTPPPPNRPVDKSNLFGSPKSRSPSTPKEPEIKVENNTLFSRDDESSNDSVKMSSREASPVQRPPSKSPSPLPPVEPVKKPEPEKKKEPSPKKKDKKEKKKDKKVDKEKDHEKKKKRKSDPITNDKLEPPEKIVKLEEENNSDEESKVSSTEDTAAVIQPKSECDMDMLRELQRKIMSLKDNSDLQKVVQLIAETGQYEVSAHTFDFDLCLLDRSTVRQLQDFFSTIS
uniref:Protein ENL isoform X1 n=2 Tax=Diabrotica virgifera virgifera TaxID=50390 RepID=A0A6P7G415_DIAVI